MPARLAAFRRVRSGGFLLCLVRKQSEVSFQIKGEIGFTNFMGHIFCLVKWSGSLWCYDQFGQGAAQLTTKLKTCLAEFALSEASQKNSRNQQIFSLLLNQLGGVLHSVFIQTSAYTHQNVSQLWLTELVLSSSNYSTLEGLVRSYYPQYLVRTYSIQNTQRIRKKYQIGFSTSIFSLYPQKQRLDWEKRALVILNNRHIMITVKYVFCFHCLTLISIETERGQQPTCLNCPVDSACVRMQEYKAFKNVGKAWGFESLGVCS